MQFSPPSSKEEVQAILDIAVVRDVPLRYVGGLFKIKKIDIGQLISVRPRGSPKDEVATQYIETALRWMDDYDKWKKK